VRVPVAAGPHGNDLGQGNDRRPERAIKSSPRGWNVAALLKLSGVIDAVNLRIGKALSWLVLIVVLISATNATIRKVFDTSSNAWLELQWILFGVVFLLCSPWTLLSNEHIRIDIVNNFFPKKVRDSIDVVGHVFFLLPLTILMIVTSAPFFWKSILLNEQSMNAGGLPQWPAKFLVLLGFVMLFFQGISELIKRVAVMQGKIPDPYAASHHPLETEIEQLARSIEKR
jgi:TRAP-type mannitol/chloroaromatic compound transport system permease small subunit